MPDEIDYLVLGDVEGLTKLEVLYVLQDVIVENGLHEKAVAAIKQAAEESNARLLEIHGEDE